MPDLYLLGHVLLHRVLEDRDERPRAYATKHEDSGEAGRPPALRSGRHPEAQPAPANVRRSAV